MDHKQYINVTENGSARISYSKTPSQIDGLCVKGLETCTAIVIIGSEGMSVIHDEGFLSIESIKKEFEFVGTLKEWSIFYNPKCLKANELASRMKEMQTILYDEKYKKEYVMGDKNDLFHAVENGGLILEREKSQIIFVNTNPVLSNIKEPKDFLKRKAVRHLNNMCAHKLSEERHATHRLVPIDLQFDGKAETSPPPLILSYEKADNIVRCTVNSWDDKKARREYAGYLSMVASDNKDHGESKFFKPERNPIAEFNKLEKLYKETKNEALLLKLVENACEVVERCGASCDYEGAEAYSEDARNYLNLALKSDNPNIKDAANKLQKEINESIIPKNKDEEVEENQFQYF